MSKHDKEEKEMKEFLEKTFPTGEYFSLTVLVRKEEFGKLMSVLRKGELNVGVMPDLTGLKDEYDDEGTIQ